MEQLRVLAISNGVQQLSLQSLNDQLVDALYLVAEDMKKSKVKGDYSFIPEFTVSELYMYRD
jgi:hypothetical protein